MQVALGMDNIHYIRYYWGEWKGWKKINSNSLRLDYIECDINTVANKVVRITSESITKGKVPEDDNYIPIVHAQTSTNEYEVSIRYDYPSWIVYSNVSQGLGIRFFKCTK